jgi:hypothetical protein
MSSRLPTATKGQVATNRQPPLTIPTPAATAAPVPEIPVIKQVGATALTMGRSFADLQALYDRMVWVDSTAEAQAFMADVQVMQ